MSDQYVWLTWASSFLLPWLLLLWRYPAHRRVMLWASVLTTPFGLTEPLFIPRYWNPPSLFGLAQRTGFDLESLIFCFAIGGVGSRLYDMLTRRSTRPLPTVELAARRHRYHRLLLCIPVIVFPLLYPLAWNPIYPAILAMLAGGVATVTCRPDLAANTGIGGTLFALYYVSFVLGLELSAPGYIGRVWNLRDLSGVLLARVPLEEILFGFAFGLYWSGLYEHLTWRRSPRAVKLRGAPARRRASQ